MTIRKGIPIAARLCATGDLARNAVEMMEKIGTLTPVSRGALGYYTFRCDCGNVVQKNGAAVRNEVKRIASGKRKTPINCGAQCGLVTKESA